ncbi:MAG: tetratricopeptide repeat protein [Deltaproteobacteria bacterium]|nr:tetratricopeptide repeat protein [Deltaproteobacteria bacterium]
MADISGLTTTDHRILENSKLRTPNSYRMFFRVNLMWAILTLLILAACTSSLQRKEDALAYMRLGDSMLREGRPTQALAELIKANDLDPNNPVIRNVLGIAYLEKGMVRQAIHQFEKALYLDPNYVEVHNNLGTALLRDGRVQEAIKEFNTALENPMYPTPHFVQYNLGQAHFTLKEFDKAREYYMEALKLSPAYSLAYHGLGLAWKATDHMEEAAEALKKAIENAPKFAQAHYDLGEVLLELKQPSLARLAFREVISLVPESDLGRKAQQRLKELK